MSYRPGFNHAFSPSLIDDHNEDSLVAFAPHKPLGRLSKLGHTKPSVDLGLLDAPLREEKEVPVQGIPSLDNIARLSLGFKSPLFDITSVNAMQFPDLADRGAEEHGTRQFSPPPPKLDYSSSPATSAAPSTLHLTSGTQPSNEFAKPGAEQESSHFTTSGSDTEGRRFADRQLELLHELFPNATRHTSLNTENNPSIPDAMPEENRPELPEGNLPHDIQRRSRLSQLLDDWPQMDELTGGPTVGDFEEPEPVTSSSPLKISQKGTLSLKIALEGGERQRPFDNASALDQSSVSRPVLSIDTASTHDFASKELQLIKRLKDGSKSAIRPKGGDPSNLSAPSCPPKVASNNSVPCMSSALIHPKANVLTPPESSLPVPNVKRTPSYKTMSVNLGKSNSNKVHMRKLSTESAVSGIVWSAVVEKFSELAQEIAGKVSPKEDSGVKVLESATALATPPDHAETKVPKMDSETPVDEQRMSRLSVKALGITKGHVIDSSSDSERTLATATSSKATSHASSPAKTSPRLTSLVPLTARSRTSIQLTSILKHLGVSDDNNNAEIGTGDLKDVKGTTVQKTRRSFVRTVRVLSHHADGDSSKVEGDYAKFLKRASKYRSPSSSEEDNSSKLSSCKSTKSGVENGLYRRGSMRSIHSGLTIATVGGVSVRDMSRGARFRHPSPFFANNHGWKKPHGPHQDPAVARRKLSKTKKGIKRNSGEAEPLHLTLTRLKEEKRQAPPSLIGELAFESDSPARVVPRMLPGPANSIEASPRAGKKTRTKSGYAASSIDSASHKSPSPSAHKVQGYSASSVGLPGSGSVVGSATAAALNRQHARNKSSGEGPYTPFRIAGGNTRTGYSASEIGSAYESRKGPAPALSLLSSTRTQILSSGTSNQFTSRENHKHHPAAGSWSLDPHDGHSSFVSPPSKYATGPTLPQASTFNNSFITMTPSRSEISVSSDRDNSLPIAANSRSGSSSDGVQRFTSESGRAFHINRSLESAPPMQLVQYRDSPKRAATAPLPPLPSVLTTLPLRASNTIDVETNRMSASHRPQVPLSINTNLAKENLRKQQERAQARAAVAAAVTSEKRKSSMNDAKKAMSLKSIKKGTYSMADPAEAYQPLLPALPQSTAYSSNSTVQEPSTAATTRTFHQRHVSSSSDGTSAFSLPKSAGAAVINAFNTPRRPARKESSSPTIPLRYPRPQSVSPVTSEHRVSEDQGSNFYEYKDPSAARSNSTGKAITKLLGLGKKKRGAIE